MQQVFTINQTADALHCARSSVYRMEARGEIEIVATPVGPRVTRAEIERLTGKPIDAAHEPGLARQAAAAHARQAKRDAAGLAAEFRAFMQKTSEQLDRIEEQILSGQGPDSLQRRPSMSNRRVREA